MIVGINTLAGATVYTVRRDEYGGKLAADLDLSLVGGPPVALGSSVEGRVGIREKGGLRMRRSSCLRFV